MLCRPHPRFWAALYPPSPPLLPPRARPQPSSARSFHSSKPNRLVVEALEASRSYFEYVHDTSGLGWGGTIFLTGLTCRLPWFGVTAWVARAQNQHNKAMLPLQTAWNRHLYSSAETRFPASDPANNVQRRKWIYKQQKLIDSLANSRPSALNTPSFLQINPQTLPQLLLQSTFLPVWILNLDVVRCMAGAPSSILPWLDLPSALDVVHAEPSFATETFLSPLTAADLYTVPVFASCFVSLQLLRLKKGQRTTHIRIDTDDRYEQVDYAPLFALAMCFIPQLVEWKVAGFLYLIGSSTGQLLSTLCANYLIGAKYPLGTTLVRNARLKARHRKHLLELDKFTGPSAVPTTSSTPNHFPGAGQTPKLRADQVLPKHSSRSSAAGGPTAYKSE